jgi:hypothetical protein
MKTEIIDLGSIKMVETEKEILKDFKIYKTDKKDIIILDSQDD